MFDPRINFDPYVVYHPYKTFSEWCEQRFKSCFYAFSDDLLLNNNVSFTRASLLSKFSGQKVLIIGGGPSTLSLNLDIVKEYDSCWSMNQFYKNKEIANIKMDLIALSSEVSFNCADLNNYIRQYNPLIGFEPRHRWTIPFHKFMCNSFAEDKSCFGFMTYFGGKIGVGSSLINLAGELGAESVSFIGLDGIPKIFDKVHAFEKGKSTLPIGATRENSHILCKAHYDMFWNKMKKDYPNTKFISLQEENEFHDPHLK